MSEREEFEKLNAKPMNAVWAGRGYVPANFHSDSLDCFVYEKMFEAHRNAKESSRKELEAAKRRIAELEEESLARAYGWTECKSEKEALEKKLAMVQSAISHEAYHFPSSALSRLRDGFGEEELAKLLAAARAEGFEEGKQAGRYELRGPEAWLVFISGKYSHIRDTDPGVCEDADEDSESEIRYVPLYSLPAPPTKKG